MLRPYTLLNFLACFLFISCTSHKLDYTGKESGPVNIDSFNSIYTRSFTVRQRGNYIASVRFDVGENRMYLLCAFGDQPAQDCDENQPKITASYTIVSSNGDIVDQNENVRLKPLSYGKDFAGVIIGFISGENGEKFTINLSLHAEDNSLLKANPRIVIMKPFY